MTCSVGNVALRGESYSFFFFFYSTLSVALIGATFFFTWQLNCMLSFIITIWNLDEIDEGKQMTFPSKFNCLIWLWSINCLSRSYYTHYLSKVWGQNDWNIVFFCCSKVISHDRKSIYYLTKVSISNKCSFECSIQRILKMRHGFHKNIK